MAGRATFHTPRRRRNATSTSGRLHWRLPTRKASRSANKAFGLKLQSGGGDPAPPFFVVNRRWGGLGAPARTLFLGPGGGGSGETKRALKRVREGERVRLGG